MPTQGVEFLASPRVPQLDRLVIARRGQHLAVRGKRHALDPFCLPAQGAEFLTRPRVPQLDRLVITRGGEQVAVCYKRHAPDDVRVPAEGTQASRNVILEQAPARESELRGDLIQRVFRQRRLTFLKTTLGQ